MGQRWLPRPVLTVGALALVGGALLMTVLSSAAQSDATYYACRRAGKGTIRLVDANAACKKNETKISWVRSGPPGPPGPQGAAGPLRDLSALETRIALLETIVAGTGGAASATPTLTAAATPSGTPTASPTHTALPTSTPTRTSTATPDSGGVPTATATATATVTPTQQGGTVHQVQVGQDFQTSFSPGSSTIAVGDTVTWNWLSGPHTVTSGQEPAADGTFCSTDDLNCSVSESRSSGTYSHTFSAAGSFPYFCQLHFGMTGTITVQ